MWVFIYRKTPWETLGITRLPLLRFTSTRASKKSCRTHGLRVCGEVLSWYGSILVISISDASTGKITRALKLFTDSRIKRRLCKLFSFFYEPKIGFRTRSLPSDSVCVFSETNFKENMETTVALKGCKIDTKTNKRRTWEIFLCVFFVVFYTQDLSNTGEWWVNMTDTFYSFIQYYIIIPDIHFPMKQQWTITKSSNLSNPIYIDGIR